MQKLNSQKSNVFSKFGYEIALLIFLAAWFVIMGDRKPELPYRKQYRYGNYPHQ